MTLILMTMNCNVHPMPPEMRHNMKGTYHASKIFCSHVYQVVTYGVYMLYWQKIYKVVVELGPEHIMHIVTDNGSNYKKACKMISHKFLIVWQSCLIHTINLILKAFGALSCSRKHLQTKAGENNDILPP
jgi:hypothetical protein